MNIFLIFAYGTVVLLCVVLGLSIWVVASNAVYVNLEKKNQILRTKIKILIVNLLHENNEHTENADHLRLKKLLLRHKELCSGVLAQLVRSNTGISGATLIDRLREYGLPTIAKQGLNNLKSRRKKKRLWAAANLPFLAPVAHIVPALRATLTDNIDAVRLAAAQALSTIHSAESACEIIEHLSERKNIPWSRIVELMPMLGHAAIDPLMQSLHLQSLASDQRAITLASLGALRAKKAEHMIADHMNDADKDIRIQAAKALGKLPAEHSTRILIAALDDLEWEVRLACAQALGNIADPSAARALFEHLGDSVYWVRYNSAYALSKMGKVGIEQLGRGLTSQDPFAQDICQLVLAKSRSHQND